MRRELKEERKKGEEGDNEKISKTEDAEKRNKSTRKIGKVSL
jgi:hypothetical protein